MNKVVFMKQKVMLSQQGKLGVAVVTVDQGATNIAGITRCYSDSVPPLRVFTGPGSRQNR